MEGVGWKQCCGLQSTLWGVQVLFLWGPLGKKSLWAELAGCFSWPNHRSSSWNLEQSSGGWCPCCLQEFPSHAQMGPWSLITPGVVMMGITPIQRVLTWHQSRSEVLLGIMSFISDNEMVRICFTDEEMEAWSGGKLTKVCTDVLGLHFISYCSMQHHFVSYIYDLCMGPL